MDATSKGRLCEEPCGDFHHLSAPAAPHQVGGPHPPTDSRRLKYPVRGDSQSPPRRSTRLHLHYPPNHSPLNKCHMHNWAMGIIRIVISSSVGQTGGIVIDSRWKLDPQCSTKDDGNYASVFAPVVHVWFSLTG